VEGCGGRDAGNDEENPSKEGVAVEERLRDLTEKKEMELKVAKAKALL
jgi:hypothetical protein